MKRTFLYTLSYLLLLILVPLHAQNNVTMTLNTVNETVFRASGSDWQTDRLFWVSVTNNESAPMQFRISYTLTASRSALISGDIVKGWSRVGTKQWDGTNGQGYLSTAQSELIENNDYTKIERLEIDPTFNQVIYDRGRLPPGEYTLTVYLQVISWNHPLELYFQNPYDSDFVVQTLTDNWVVTTATPSPPLLSTPQNESVVNVSNPTFTWFSIYTVEGLKTFYEINICLKEDGQSNQEAIDNLSFWNNNYDVEHIGTGGTSILQWQYPPEADPLVSGRQYVWQISVYDEEGFYDFTVDDPLFSEIWMFNYGSPPELLQPSNGSMDLSSVTPSFTWETILGATNYEIAFGDRDDPLVEIPIWNAILNDASYTYSADAPPLIPLPSYQYFWKVRVNPLESIPGNWSEEIYSFAITSLEMQEPGSGTSVSSLTPGFTWSGPTGVGGYEFRISSGDDEQVENPIFIQNVTSNSLTYPTDGAILSPGASYNWKVIALNQNENYMGSVDEYLDAYNFSIDPVVPSSPAEGSGVSSLTPVFSWEAPTGIPSFEFQMFYGENASGESPDFNVKVNSNSYQLNASEFLLGEGLSYFWKVIALDGDDLVMGNVTDYTMSGFNVEGLDLTIPVITASISEDTPNLPVFSLASPVENADGYSIRLSATEDMTDIKWESDILSSLPYTLTSGDATLLFDATYFVQGQAFQESEPFGDLGTIFKFSTGSQPGADEQPEMTVGF